MSKNIPSAYALIEKKKLDDIHGVGYFLKHKKSGAELVYLDIEDTNKVFTITFKTLPSDDTGVAHILEHAVLGGSRKYKAKDPFAEMLKGSLASFLNAFTFRDKTMYPVASTNWQDFMNLTDLYLDSVFYPTLSKETFAQEGWHYTFNEKKLGIKGVVYNEMKGAFSNPEEVVDEHINKQLFPDTIYKHVSGGHPDAIPELSYEHFKQFHKTYYHPSNAKIFFAGDMPLKEYLEFLDKEYLSEFHKVEISHQIPLQEKKDILTRIETQYPISANEKIQKKTIIAQSYLLGTTSDVLTNLSFSVLAALLSGMENSPLRRALLESNLGESLYGGGYSNSFKQGFYTIGLRGTDKEHEKKVTSIITATLKSIVANGFDQADITAALNSVEFSLREADFGQYPKGLVYAIESLQSWLYDQDPFEPLSFSDELLDLRTQAKEGYFEKLVEKHLLKNRHSTVVVAEPSPTLEKKQEKKRETLLNQLQKKMSTDQLAEIAKCAQHIGQLQQTPNTLEQLATLPRLELSEIQQKQEVVSSEISTHGGLLFVNQPITTNGLVYVDVLFDISSFTLDELQDAELLSELLTILPTSAHTMKELEQEIMTHTGGLSSSVSASKNITSKETRCYFHFTGKSLLNQAEKLFQLTHEMLTQTKIEHIQKVEEILKTLLQQQRLALTGSGHQYAVRRALAHHTEHTTIAENLAGIEWYHYCNNTLKSFKKDPEKILAKLRKIQEKLTQAACIIDITTDTEHIKKVTEIASNQCSNWKDITPPSSLKWKKQTKQSEGFIIPSQVQYVASAGSLSGEAEKQRGTIAVLKSLIDIDYLWLEIRIKGGAYGGFSMYNPYQQSWAFASYRDPNLDQTLATFAATANYITSAQFSKDDLRTAIIGAIRKLDTPLTPSQQGAKALGEYLSGITHDIQQGYRDQILHTSIAELTSLANIFEKQSKQAATVVVGSESAIEKSKHSFDKVVELFE